MPANDTVAAGRDEVPPQLRVRRRREDEGVDALRGAMHHRQAVSADNKIDPARQAAHDGAQVVAVARHPLNAKLFAEDLLLGYQRLIRA